MPPTSQLWSSEAKLVSLPNRPPAGDPMGMHLRPPLPQSPPPGRSENPAFLSQNRSWMSTRPPPFASSYSEKFQLLALASRSTNGRFVALATKNTMHAGDALLIEEAFRQKIAELQPLPDRPGELTAPQVSSPSEVAPHATGNTAADPDQAATDLADFEHYAVTPKPRRLRDKLHREFVAAQPCVVCGRQPSDAHHLRFTQPRALGRKVSDEFTVPLCRMHHREIHRTAKEQHWWSRVGIDPIPIADKLWAQTHPGTRRSPAQIQADTLSVQSTAAP